MEKVEKIRNFGNVVYNRKNNRIDYSYFIKNQNGSWTKKHSSKTIYNEVFIPNTEAVIKKRLGGSGGLIKDLWGNEILVSAHCEFFDSNPPEVIKNNKKVFSSDISPIVKFLSDNFEFDEEKDEIPPIKVIYFDIETRVDDGGFLQGWDSGCDRGGVYLISCFNNLDGKTTVFGVKPFNSTALSIDSNVEYFNCREEKNVIIEFLKYLKREKPEILSGWNISGYDIPYLINRMVYLFGEKSLYHFGHAKAWIKNEAKKFIINGISIVDYIVIFKKFTLKQYRSYSLANICEEEDIGLGGEGKHKLNCSFHEMFERHWDDFVKYCIQDTKLVYEIDKKKQLMNLFVTICYTAGISFDSVIAQDFSWLRVHDAAIYRFCKKHHLELPIVNKDNFGIVEKFSGAYIMEPTPGLYDWVSVYDVVSLYPSVIRSLNISMDTFRGKIISKCGYKTSNGLFDEDFNILPGIYEIEIYDSLNLSLGCVEKEIIDKANRSLIKKIDSEICKVKKLIFQSGKELVEWARKNNYSISANGCFFTQDFRGIIPSLLDKWMEERKKYKNQYQEYKSKYQETGKIEYKIKSEIYDIYQLNKKLCQNSLYGYLGTKYSRFYNVDLAEAVTKTGQFLIKSVTKELSKNNCNVVYNDTDSAAASSIIHSCDYGDITIEDLFKKIKNDDLESYVEKFDGRKFVFPNNKRTLYYDEKNGACEGLIMFVEKHKVGKDMYRIKTKKNFVDITEDHSVMVLRDNRLQEIKPQNIIKGDQVIEII